MTNIWAPKLLWLRELERVGVLALLCTAVFSSDGRSIKPSPRPFLRALSGAQAEPEQVIFVGDSLRCDIEGAKGVGMRTVFVTGQHVQHDAVDHCVTNVLALEHLEG